MEPLSDPIKDRVVKQVKPPPHRPLDPKLMFPDKLKRIIKMKETLFHSNFLKDKPDWKLIRDHLQREGRIRKEEIKRLIYTANKLLGRNLMEIILNKKNLKKMKEM